MALFVVVLALQFITRLRFPPHVPISKMHSVHGYSLVAMEGFTASESVLLISIKRSVVEYCMTDLILLVCSSVLF